jgi:hypothetical protein
MKLASSLSLAALSSLCVTELGLLFSTAHAQSLDPITSYNTVLGTQTIGPAYKFSDESALLETARRIRHMGSHVLKLSLNGNSYAGLEGAPKNLMELVQWGDFKTVLDMDFAYYQLWAYSEVGNGWLNDDYNPEERETDYQAIYDLTTYLLRTYSGSGKTFYLGHWEGDWTLLVSFDEHKNPTPQQVKQMTEWYNVRQSAVDDAKAALAGQVSDVQVFQYAEVNRVGKAMRDSDPNDGVLTITNDILPNTNVDYVSYSSWDQIEKNPLKGIEPQLTAALDYIESKLPKKDDLPTEKRVWIGEYGWPLDVEQTPDAVSQAAYSRETARVALAWGAPFILYWEFYNNEVPDGQHRGFWLIDNRNQEQPFYWMMKDYYEASERYLNEFNSENGRMPTESEFRAFAEALLRP